MARFIRLIVRCGIALGMDVTSLKPKSLKPKSLLSQCAAWCSAGRLNALLATLARSAKRPPVWIPLLLLIAFTLLMRGTEIDLAVSGVFYNQASDEWSYWGAHPWDWLYRWGVVPGIALGVGGLAVYLLSFSVKRLERHRRGAAFLALALVIGPGIIVNGIMKPGWGRPRPCQVIQFGGDANYLPPFEIGHYHRSASFPSGHASIGFALIAPAFLAFRKYRYLAAALFAGGMCWGMAMGLTRIVQGGHFLSDVIWSAAIVYFTCWSVAALMRLYDAPQVAIESVDSADNNDQPQVFRLPQRSTEEETQTRKAA